MKSKDVLYIGIVCLLILIFWLFDDKKQRAEKVDRIIKRLRKDNYETKLAYLTLFEKYLKSQQNVDVSLIAEVEKLKNSVSKLDFETHIELENIINSLSGGKSIDAVRRLAKIVESNLKKRVDEDNTFKGKKMLDNLLRHAKKSNWITSRQFENALLLKEIRNKESHELAVVQDANTVGMCIFSSIELLNSISI